MKDKSKVLEPHWKISSTMNNITLEEIRKTVSSIKPTGTPYNRNLFMDYSGSLGPIKVRYWSSRFRILRVGKLRNIIKNI